MNLQVSTMLQNVENGSLHPPSEKRVPRTMSPNYARLLAFYKLEAESSTLTSNDCISRRALLHRMEIDLGEWKSMAG